MDILDFPDGHTVRLRSAARGTPIKDHPRASLVGGSYESELDAREAAEHIRESLLIWAVTRRFGVDTGDGHVRSRVTEAGKAAFAQEHDKVLRTDVHGIDVYPDEGDVVFMHVKADIGVGKDAPTFAAELRGVSKRTWTLSEKQKFAAELYCASFFDQVFRSRFITLVTTVEALLEAQPRAAAVQAFVERTKASLQDLDVEPATKQALASGLDGLRRDSIGQAGRRMSDELLAGRTYGGLPSGKFFNRCYSIRSQTVHRGAPEDPDIDFLDLANKCQEFVGDLLVASFEASASREP